MGLLSFFRKKPQISSSDSSSMGGNAAWQESTFQAADVFREPLSPLTPMMSLTPPPSLERPFAFSQAETQTILAKLDVLAARMEQINIRLEKIEQAIHLQQPQQVQQPVYQTLRRW